MDRRDPPITPTYKLLDSSSAEKKRVGFNAGMQEMWILHGTKSNVIGKIFWIVHTMQSFDKSV